MNLYEQIKDYLIRVILALAILAPVFIWAVQKYDDVIIFMSLVQAVLCYKVINEMQSK